MVTHLKCVQPATALLSGEKSGRATGSKSVGVAMPVVLPRRTFSNAILMPSNWRVTPPSRYHDIHACSEHLALVDRRSSDDRRNLDRGWRRCWLCQAGVGLPFPG